MVVVHAFFKPFNIQLKNLKLSHVQVYFFLLRGKLFFTTLKFTSHLNLYAHMNGRQSRFYICTVLLHIRTYIPVHCTVCVYAIEGLRPMTIDQALMGGHTKAP